MTTAAGASTTNFTFPAKPAMNGLRTFEQILAVDPTTNPTGVVLSNGVNHNIGAPYRVTPGDRIYRSGSLGPTGTVDTLYLLVTRFNF